MIKRIIIATLLILIGLGIGYVFAGFLQQDDAILKQTKFAYKIVFIYGPLIILPLVYAFIVYLFLFASKEFVKATLYSIVILILTGLILLPFLQILKDSFFKSEDKFAERFHPYLQLMPPQIDKQRYKPDDINVFCLGGSTTEYTNSKGIGWPDMLEQTLRANTNNDAIDVYNLGMQWYTTQHSLINYEINIKHYRHDVLIVMHAINDLLNNADFSSYSKGSFRNDYGHFYGPLKFMIQKPGSMVSKLAGTFGRYWYQDQSRFVNQREFPGLVSFRRNLISLIEDAQLHGVRVVLMTQPSILKDSLSEAIKEKCTMINNEAIGNQMKWTYESGVNGMEQYNQLIRTVAEEKQVALVDLEKVVPKTLEYFTDEVHYTDAAYPVIQQEIAKVLIEDEYIKKVSNGK